MMKRRLVSVAVIAVLMVFTAGAVWAGQPDNSKATGGVTWTNTTSDREFKAQFNAIEGYGDKPDKGFFKQARTDGTGGFRVDITDVEVYDGCAIFGGEITEGWGGFAGWVGQARYITVVDGGGGTGERGADYIVTSEIKPTPPNDTEGMFIVTGGNVQVHYVAAE